MSAGERVRRALVKKRVQFAHDSGQFISFDKFLRELPFEVLDDCIDVGGVERCVVAIR